MDKLSILFVVIAGISWGSSGVFSNQLKLLGFSALQSATIRSLVAAVILFLIICITDKKKIRTSAKELPLFALCGICTIASGAFYFSSIQLTSLSTAVTLMYTAPIMVMLISVLFLGERFSISKLIAALLAFAGCGLVTGIIGGLRFNFLGILYGLLSGFFYCMYTILTKISTRRGNESLTTTAYSFLFGGVFAIFICQPGAAFSVLADVPSQSILWGLGIGLFSGALPYFFYTLSMRKLPAGVASALSAIEPMTATIVSVLLYHEKLTISALSGILLILTSVVILSRVKEES
ncbi:MAG: hypothetical protein E7418_01350 [Ruminococcaceae bacterium]|nr:hypothetical protein [Oscillospiraceae bacterium]